MQMPFLSILIMSIDSGYMSFTILEVVLVIGGGRDVSHVDGGGTLRVLAQWLVCYAGKVAISHDLR